MAEANTVIIPYSVWCRRGFSMLQAAERQFPNDRITFHQPRTGTDVQIRFSSIEAATMMRLIWSEHDDRG
jgi:hypothetical protein